MRIIYLTIIAVLLITACQSCGSDTEKATAQLPFTKDSLNGNWMIIRAYITNQEVLSNEPDSIIEVLKSKIVLTAFSMAPTGSLQIDAGAPARTDGSWQFSNSSHTLLLQHRQDTTAKTTPYIVTSYRNDSLTTENTIKKFGKELKMKYIFKRLTNNDTVPNLFAPALNQWRQHPEQAETDEAIKARMKQVLNYYSAYFANISGNKIPVFNLTKILCPIKFYSGGIGMKKFKDTDEWTKIFYDSKDAKKAHTLVDEAFDKIDGYPNKGRDYVSEYVIALTMVADAL